MTHYSQNNLYTKAQSLKMINLVYDVFENRQSERMGIVMLQKHYLLRWRYLKIQL